MKKILLLTDFSENSKNAIRYALELFRTHECTFTVLHVQSSTSYISDDLMQKGNISLYDSLIKTSKNKLGSLVNDFEKEFKNENYNFQFRVDYDVLTDAINQIIEKEQKDLVVMGTNGVTGAKEVLFGSNTINVIRKVDCPTMVIPEGFKYRKPKEILLPIDQIDSIKDSAIMAASKFIKRFSKKIHLLRILPDNVEAKEKVKDSKYIEDFLKENDYEFHIIKNVPIQHTVNCYTQTHNIDLMVLLVHTEGLFERFFTGSPTTQISNSLQVPLVLFHS